MMDDVVTINARVSQRLAALTASKLVKTSEMAEAMGIDENHLGRIFRGVTPPTVAQLVKAADKLGVLVSVIVGELRFDEAPQKPGAV